jgi:hypothetical protein
MHRLLTVDFFQPDFVIVFTEQTTVFLIRYAFSHVIAHPDGTQPADPVPNFAPSWILLQKTVNAGIHFQMPGQKRSTKRIFEAYLSFSHPRRFDLNQWTA